MTPTAPTVDYYASAREGLYAASTLIGELAGQPTPDRLSERDLVLMSLATAQVAATLAVVDALRARPPRTWAEVAAGTARPPVTMDHLRRMARDLLDQRATTPHAQPPNEGAPQS